MAYKSVTDGIIFIEGHINNASVIKSVEYKKNIYNQQLKNLNDIKKQLADKAKSVNANAIMDFEYGQKSASAFRSFLLAFDDNVNWYAKGIAIQLDPRTYQEFIDQINDQ